MKKPAVLNFKPLSESLTAPDQVFTDFAKFESPELLHMCYQVLHRYPRHQTPPASRPQI